MKKDLRKMVCLGLSLGLLSMSAVALAKSGEDFTQKEVWVTDATKNYAVGVFGNETTPDGDLVKNSSSEMDGAKGGSVTTYKNIAIGDKDAGGNFMLAAGSYKGNPSKQASVIKVSAGGALNVEEKLGFYNKNGSVYFGPNPGNGNYRGYGIWLEDGTLNAKDINIDAVLRARVPVTTYGEIAGLVSLNGGFNVTGDTYIKGVTGAESIHGLELSATGRDNIFQGNITINNVAQEPLVDATPTGQYPATRYAVGVSLFGDGVKENKLNGKLTIGTISSTLSSVGISNAGTFTSGWTTQANKNTSFINEAQIGTIEATNTNGQSSAEGIKSLLIDTSLNINKVEIGTINSRSQNAWGVNNYVQNPGTNNLTLGTTKIDNIIANDKATGVYVNKGAGVTNLGNITLGTVQSNLGAAFGIQVSKSDNTSFNTINMEKVENSVNSLENAVGIDLGALGEANVNVAGKVQIKNVLAHAQNATGIRTAGLGIHKFADAVQIDQVDAAAVATGVSMSSKASEWQNITVGKVVAQTSVATGIAADGSGVSDPDKVVATVHGDVEVKEIHGNLGVSTGKNAALEARSGATLDIKGGAKVNLEKKSVNMEEAALAESGGKLFINNSRSKDVQINGDLRAKDTDSELNVKMTTSNSFIEGKSAVDDGGVLNLEISATNATWHMTADSAVTTLHAKDGGIINMAFNPDSAVPYQTLTLDELKGAGGIFRMDTDLGSETAGDKIHINVAAENGTHFIEVKDLSAAGTQVLGEKKLLLVKDASGKSVFEGKTYSGLWDTQPTVEKIGNDWYLVKLVKSESETTQTIIGNINTGYGLWRNIVLDDTLRKRAGDLRYNETDAGVWARVKTGRLASSRYEGSYSTYQVGMDKKRKNDILGFAVDYSQGKTNYVKGFSNNSNVGLSLYATNYRKDGVYSDIVLRAGKVRSDLVSTEAGNGNFDYDVWGYSGSYEMGKTYRQAKGWFIEPQGQLVYGHVQGGNYTTNLGMKIQKDGMTSVLGRLGVVVGRQVNKNSDYYVKANVYREFAGSADMHLSLNGENMKRQEENKDTWLEVGVGGNVKLAKKTHLYGDVLKTFGADIQKKWQINAGVRWEF